MGGIGARADVPVGSNTIYSPDPNHLWNRLNQTLFVRTAPDGRQYDSDGVDILYWLGTKHLLVEPSHHEALAILDEFINTHGERLISDPLARTFLQRDLWELFDWSAKRLQFAEDAPAARELESRLATAIRRLALTTNEIAALPDNYAPTETKSVPDLPRGLFQTNGDWVLVRDLNDRLTAPSHAHSFDGHSAFYVLLHVPGGRSAAISYLDELRRFEHAWIYRTNTEPFITTNMPREILELNPALPEFPTNTEWALARRLCVIDTEGRIRLTPVIENIQGRRYYSLVRNPIMMVTNENGAVVSIRPPGQDVFEFQMDRRNRGDLREVGKNERGYTQVHFMGFGIDQFEPSRRNFFDDKASRDSAARQSVILDSCMACHSAPGIFSVNSYTRFLSFSVERPANLTPLPDVNYEAGETISWKENQFDWGVLQTLWHASL